MREIKFRAWDKENSVLFAPDRLDWSDGSLIGVSVFNGDEWQGIHIGDIVLMQYTGLKDKNGKEIYEGDIVKLGQVDEDTITQEETFTNYKVIFGTPPEAHFGYPSCFYLHSLEKMKINTYGEGTLFCRQWHSSMEIIGNIYENSDLLTNK